MRKNAEYISNNFKKLGLKTELQPFEYSVKLNPHDENSSTPSKGTNIIGYFDNKATKPSSLVRIMTI